MECEVLKQFKRRGDIQYPGSIVDVPKDMLLKLSGYIKSVSCADSYPSTKQIEPDPAHSLADDSESLGLLPAPTKFGIYKLTDFCPDRSGTTTKHKMCPCCHGVDFWRSATQEGHSVCRTCHPPAPGAEKLN